MKRGLYLAFASLMLAACAAPTNTPPTTSDHADRSVLFLDPLDGDVPPEGDGSGIVGFNGFPPFAGRAAPASPTPPPEASPVPSPTASPVASPTTAPSPSPEASPTASPTTAPTATPTVAPSPSVLFIESLSGQEEVPARATDATGEFRMELSADGTQVSYRLTVTGLDNVVGAHLHAGAAGANGPIVVPLTTQGEGGVSEGTFGAADLTGPFAGMTLAAFIDAVRQGGTYVNVHTDDGVEPADTGPGDFPGGEIRAQIALEQEATVPEEQTSAQGFGY